MSSSSLSFSTKQLKLLGRTDEGGEKPRRVEVSVRK